MLSAVNFCEYVGLYKDLPMRCDLCCQGSYCADHKPFMDAIDELEEEIQDELHGGRTTRD